MANLFNKSITCMMRVYPIIFGSRSQLIVIDGFIVSLTTNSIDEIHKEHETDRHTLNKARLLQKIFGCESLGKLQHICSNFLMTSNSLLFEIVTEKEYVTFVSKKGRFYCRKTHRSKATHVAIAVRMSWKTGPRSSKYVVYSNPLTSSGVDIRSLYEQQEEDLKSYDGEHCGNLSIFEGQQNEADFKVETITEKEILDLCGAAPTAEIRKSLPVHSVPPSLAIFKESVLRYCEKRGLVKLESLFKVFSLIPDVAQYSAQLETLYKECKALLLHNISLVHEEIFSSFCETAMVETECYRQVCDSGQQYDGITTSSQNSSQENRTMEKCKIFMKSPQAGQKNSTHASFLKSGSEIYSKAQQSNLMDSDTKHVTPQSNRVASRIAGGAPTIMQYHALEKSFGMEFLKDNSSFHRSNALEQVKLAVIGKDPSLEQLIRRIQVYSGYAEQKLLYLDLFLSLDEPSLRGGT